MSPPPLPTVNAQPTASKPSVPQGVTPPTNSSPLLLPADSQGRVESSTLETQATAAKIGAALCAVMAIATSFLS